MLARYYGPNYVVSHTALFFFVFVNIANTLYVSTVSNKYVFTQYTENAEASGGRGQTVEALNRTADVVMFRKTMKTGSTSALTAILESLLPKGYFALHNETLVISDIVRGEVLSPSPRKLLISSHNNISREHTGNLFTVIIDTVKDGFDQMTSYCRYIRKVKDCESEEMTNCLRSAVSQNQNRHRWTGRRREDTQTYIDLPICIAHPALSTTIFRRVFPDVTLDFPHINVRGSACDELTSLRKFYDELYAD